MVLPALPPRYQSSDRGGYEGEGTWQGALSSPLEVLPSALAPPSVPSYNAGHILTSLLRSIPSW